MAPNRNGEQDVEVQMKGVIENRLKSEKNTVNFLPYTQEFHQHVFKFIVENMLYIP